MMKRTALYEIHKRLGAKMVEFAGYEMPVYYSGIRQEHEAVRKRAGVFDVSHMGEFIVRGEQALELIQYVTSNDASKLIPGKVQYSCLPNETGGIVDDLLVYRLDEQAWMLVVNASNIRKDWAWISSKNAMGAEMVNISGDVTLLAVQGPLAARALQKLTDMDLGAMKYYTFQKGVFAGVENVLVSATGYTGAGGFELYFKNDAAGELWDRIFEAGAEYGIAPAGLGARDTLRIEMGYCLYGNDIDETTSPIAAGLGWITKFNKDFVNSQRLAKEKASGPEHKLCGFELTGKGVPRRGYRILNGAGKTIGRVTSGTMSPTLNKPIGLGYLLSTFSKPGTEIFIEIRNKPAGAVVVKPPFVKMQNEPA